MSVQIFKQYYSMFKAIKSEFLVPSDGSFSLTSVSTKFSASFDEKTDYKKKLDKVVNDLQDLAENTVCL